MDTLIGIFLAFLSEMEGDHGGFELGMAQGALEKAGVHAGFEELGGVRMPEGRDGHAHCGHAGTSFGGTEGALDTGPTHGRGRGRTLLVLPPRGGKEPGLVPMGFPVGT